MTEVLMIFNDNDNKSVTRDLHTLMRRCCKASLRTEGLKGIYEISLTFTDDEGIHKLNKEFRNIDKPTDVLSFPMSEDGVYEKDIQNKAYVMGDIVINLQQAERQAEEYGHSFNREVGFLCVHSMFHLMGYDHVTSEEDAAVMREKEDMTLNSLGLTRGA